MPEHPRPERPSEDRAGLPAKHAAVPDVQLARRAHQLTGLLQRITALANEATDTPTALDQAVVDVCDTMGWPAGQAVTVDDTGRLEPVGPPHTSPKGHDPDRLRQRLGAPAQPAVESVATTGRPQWVPDVGSDQDPVPNGSLQRRGWLGFPVVVDQQVTAVLQFLSIGEADPEPDFLETMGSVGRQLGVLIERNRARDHLEGVVDELERSNQQLERFAYVASHDLQEPLRKIIGFTQLLEQRYGERLDGEAGEFLDIVVDGAYRMRELINDLLAYSRTGRRQPVMDRTELSAVVDDAIDVLQPAIEEADGEVTVEHPLPAVHGNRGELREMLVNLIGNALKYRGDRAARVTVGTRREADGWWRLTIADEGIGIDPQHHERVFDVFQRLHAADTYDGTGIGLAVCREIAGHHGGRIWVDSTTGEGARFHVTLPPAAQSDEEPHHG